MLENFAADNKSRPIFHMIFAGILRAKLCSFEHKLSFLNLLLVYIALNYLGKYIIFCISIEKMVINNMLPYPQ